MNFFLSIYIFSFFLLLFFTFTCSAKVNNLSRSVAHAFVVRRRHTKSVSVSAPEKIGGPKGTQRWNAESNQTPFCIFVFFLAMSEWTCNHSCIVCPVFFFRLLPPPTLLILFYSSGQHHFKAFFFFWMEDMHTITVLLFLPSAPHALLLWFQPGLVFKIHGCECEH